MPLDAIADFSSNFSNAGELTNSTASRRCKMSLSLAGSMAWAGAFSHGAISVELLTVTLRAQHPGPGNGVTTHRHTYVMGNHHRPGSTTTQNHAHMAPRLDSCDHSDMTSSRTSLGLWTVGRGTILRKSGAQLPKCGPTLRWPMTRFPA
jgi:hypothetical protein